MHGECCSNIAGNKKFGIIIRGAHLTFSSDKLLHCKMQSAVYMLLLFSLSTAATIQYVKPNAPSVGHCPGKPCLTLDQYIQESSSYFRTGSAFEFLPGNHSLSISLNITTVSNISFRGSESGAIVICFNEVTVNNVTSLDMEGLTFILQLEGKSLAAFVFTSSQEVVIANSLFRIDSSGRGIFSIHSNITITNCLFEGNTGSSGGAIIAKQDTFLTLTVSIFVRNQAISAGGAIYAKNSTITLRGCLMDSNSAHDNGGALYCSECTIMMMEHNTFQNNFLTGRSSSLGGAIGISDGYIIATGTANFSNNTAEIGGAIYLTDTRAEFREGSITFEQNVAKYLGGGMYVGASPSFITVKQNFTFIGKTAEGLGPYDICGVLCLSITKSSIPKNNISATLLNNSGTTGGALFIEKMDGFNFSNIYARDNLGGALGILEARAQVVGANLFSRNSNLKKEATITISNSIVTFNGSNTFDYNYTLIKVLLKLVTAAL